MEIDQLETFIAVATFGGFHRGRNAAPQPARCERAYQSSGGVSRFDFIRPLTQYADVVGCRQNFAAVRGAASKDCLAGTPSRARTQTGQWRPVADRSGALHLGLLLARCAQAIPACSSKSNNRDSPRPFERGIGNGSERRSRDWAGPLASAPND